MSWLVRKKFGGSILKLSFLFIIMNYFTVQGLLSFWKNVLLVSFWGFSSIQPFVFIHIQLTLLHPLSGPSPLSSGSLQWITTWILQSKKAKSPLDKCHSKLHYGNKRPNSKKARCSREQKRSINSLSDWCLHAVPTFLVRRQSCQREPGWSSGTQPSLSAWPSSNHRPVMVFEDATIWKWHRPLSDDMASTKTKH